jgi:hypothetical protein
MSEDARSIYDAAYERGYRLGYERQAAFIRSHNEFLAERYDGERFHVSPAWLGEQAGKLKAQEEYAQAELRRPRLVHSADR